MGKSAAHRRLRQRCREQLGRQRRVLSLLQLLREGRQCAYKGAHFFGVPEQAKGQRQVSRLRLSSGDDGSQHRQRPLDTRRPCGNGLIIEPD